MDNELLKIRWDLSDLYDGLDDVRLGEDILEYERLCGEIAAFKGHLSEQLAKAAAVLAKLSEISSGISAYYYFLSSRDAENTAVKKAMSAAEERMSKAGAKLAFFDIEIGALSAEDYERQAAGAKWKPYTDFIRRDAKYQLSESEESLLAKLAPFGGGEWDDMLDEMESRLSFDYDGKAMNLSEIVHLMNSSQSALVRAGAMKCLDNTLRESSYAWLRTRALNLVAGKKNTLDEERGFDGVLKARNLSNNLSDGVVEALHESVKKYAVPQMARYYKLLAKILGVSKLSWADRNAPLPFEDNRYIPYKEAEEIVLAAYSGFSPKIAGLLRESVLANRIDAPVYKGKNSGAYNYTIVGKGGKVMAFTFLNYLGTTRDVMTMAHELGHSAHGQIAGAEQGVLLAQAPMAYAETASIFGEMLTFEHLLALAGAKEEKLCLLMGKANDWINSVGRQISFSYFEQYLHNVRRSGKLAEADLNGEWIRLCKEFYGDIFEYKDMESLWSYVGHFMRPFYVYAYAFGELFTQSLFACRESLGARFEPLYIEMLGKGGSCDAEELMAPFGLNPNDENFWKKGIEVSIEKWLDEAEKLAG